MQAIPTSLRPRRTTSEALLSFAYSVAELILVQLRRDRARLRGRGRLRAKQTSNQLSGCFSETSPSWPGESVFRCAPLFFAAVEIVLRVSLIPRRRDLPDRQVYFARL